jgi:predicted 3-demethylubiquinone-9 3-methyltransferase (glyoxalase superfamily)
MANIQRIVPFLWFDSQAEDAMNFYVAIFRNSKVLGVSRYPEGAPGKAGTVMSVKFQLEGQEFMGLNGGPLFKFTEAISMFVKCETQEEVDELWGKLTAGGQESQCGWLKDKFGLSWQIVPNALPEVLGGEDRAGAQRAMQAMLKMKKLDVQKLKDAYAGKG